MNTNYFTTTPNGAAIPINFYINTALNTIPANQTTIGQFPPDNPNWSRAVQLNSQYVFVKRGANGIAFLVEDLVKIAVSQVPALSWPPIYSTQPTNQSCVHNSTSATFTIVDGPSESPVTAHQWQYQVAGMWHNITSSTPINGCVYSGYDTTSLVCTPTTIGQNGVYHRCTATNLSGTSATNTAVLYII
jgi:hypothetical protein